MGTWQVVFVGKRPTWNLNMDLWKLRRLSSTFTSGFQVPCESLPGCMLQGFSISSIIGDAFRLKGDIHELALGTPAGNRSTRPSLLRPGGDRSDRALGRSRL